ncbi:MAG: helix-turn-helix transcriptional regulator [Oscillospiraceae bacterium]|nr:helix-turn-helix transcriptional regulator [Oscillospiraceae bacterium]
MIREEGYARVREYRKKSHISQHEMAAMLGISRRTYANYENGLNSMPAEILIQIADYFDESLDVLAEHVPVQSKNG